MEQCEARTQEWCASSCLLLQGDEVQWQQWSRLLCHCRQGVRTERSWMEASVRPPILLQERQEVHLPRSAAPHGLRWPLEQRPHAPRSFRSQEPVPSRWHVLLHWPSRWQPSQPVRSPQQPSVEDCHSEQVLHVRKGDWWLELEGPLRGRLRAHSLFPQCEAWTQEWCACSRLLLPSDEVQWPQRWQLRSDLHSWLQEER